MRLQEYARQITLWSSYHHRTQRYLHQLYKCLHKYQLRITPPNSLIDLINAILRLQQKGISSEPSLEQDYNYSMSIYIDLETSLDIIYRRLTELLVLETSTNKFIEYVLPREFVQDQAPNQEQLLD